MNFANNWCVCVCIYALCIRLSVPNPSPNGKKNNHFDVEKLSPCSRKQKKCKLLLICIVGAGASVGTLPFRFGPESSWNCQVANAIAAHDWRCICVKCVHCTAFTDYKCKHSK